MHQLPPFSYLTLPVVKQKLPEAALGQMRTTTRMAFVTIIKQSKQKVEKMNLPEEKKQLFFSFLPLLIIHHAATLAALTKDPAEDPYAHSEYNEIPEWVDFRHNESKSSRAAISETSHVLSSMALFCEYAGVVLTTQLYKEVESYLNEINLDTFQTRFNSGVEKELKNVPLKSLYMQLMDIHERQQHE